MPDQQVIPNTDEIRIALIAAALKIVTFGKTRVNSEVLAKEFDEVYGKLWKTVHQTNT